MACFTEEEGVLRIPAASPCRRDYQLRSTTSASDCDSSQPQSPWLPRSQIRHSGELMSPFRLYESGLLDRPSSLSGPLPVASPVPARLYLSGPLPSPSHTFPSYFDSSATGPEILTTARSSRQLAQSSSFVARRLPETVRTSSRESSSREDVGVSGDDDSAEVSDVPYNTTYPDDSDRLSRVSPPPGTNLRDARVHNCKSGELGRSVELPRLKAKAARGFKSGEIVGLEIRADGIFPIPESRKEDVTREAKSAMSREVGVTHIHRARGSVLWEALNDADNESPGSYESSSAMAPKGSDCSSKLSYSGWDSSTSKQARIMSEQEVKPDAQTSAVDTRSVAKLVKSSSALSAKAELEPVVSSAVPFKWEVAPGKPKRDEKLSRSPKAAPVLQLPPRLASASSMKRNSWSSTQAPPHRVRPTNRSLSASLLTSSQSHGSQEEPQSPSPQSASPASPTPRTGARPRGLSGALSQFGTPQYQSAEYLDCEDSAAWSNRVRSPTSTLCGPGTPTSSSSCSEKSSTGKPSITSFSHSQTSGTSAESFDHWSYGDHVSPTSRHPYAESQGSSGERSVRVHDEGEQIANNNNNNNGGAIVKLRRKLNLKLSSSKPPISPIREASSSRAVNDVNAYSEEFFDCQAHASSSPSPSSAQQEVEPATRLPYKMPSPARDDVEGPQASASSSSSSPTREFTNCLAMPRFLLSKGETTPCLWVDNPAWNRLDNNAPTSSLEDGFRSPAYKATLELLSPSPSLLSKKTGSRSVKLLSSLSQRRHSHLVEALCNSLKQSLQRCTKRSVARTHSIVLYDDHFTKRQPSFMW